MSAAPGTRISHYRIVSELGSGGMGAVFRAHDERLGRDVAIKVLRADSSGDENARARLIREARLASSLNHPHVAHIYEVGEDQGQVFVVMELVEGRTLQSAIPPGGLPTAEVLRVAFQIADALTHAHGHDLIHRDLKSANVMLDTEGRVKILDFGLAKRTPDATRREPAASLELTEPGIVMGTPNHLSPEVLRGQPADARSDLWALGVVLYEMASGRMPFTGQSMADLAAAIVGTEPSPLSGRVPIGLQAVIARCLAKEPSRRYARAGEVRAALEALRSGATPLPPAASPARRALILASGLGVIAIILALAWFPGGLGARLSNRGAFPAPPGSGARPVIRSLAVLPLANLSGDPEQEYFADGMTEELITDLAPTPALKVISRTSVMRFKGTKLTIPQIAKELGVDAIVEGSVLRVGDRVRVTAQLIHAATDHHLWARSFERDFREVLTLQSEVARDIAEEVQVELMPHVAERMAHPRMVNPEAYELYLRGRHAWNLANPTSVRESIDLFERAAALDPHDARYPAGIADSYLLQVQMLGTIPVVEGMAKVREHSRKALQLDPQSAEARASYAAALVFGDWNVRDAQREIERALALNPGYSPAHLIHSVVKAVQGDVDAAIAANQRALELDPYSLLNLWHGIVTYRARERYDEALQLAHRALGVHPGSPLLQEALLRIHEQRDDYPAALALLDRALSAAERDLAVSMRRAWETSGQAGYWKAAIAYTLKSEKRPVYKSVSLAYMYARAGEKTRSIEELEKAADLRVSDVLFVGVEPSFRVLVGEPRFQALVKRVGIPLPRAETAAFRR